MLSRRLCIAFLFLSLAVRAADPAPADFAEYKTPQTAKLAQIQKVRFQGPQTGHLGVGVEVVENRLKVSRVAIGSAAEKSGFQIGDVLVSIEDKAIGSEEALRKYLAQTRAGQIVTVIAERNGKRVVLPARLQALSNPLGEEQPKPALGVKTNEIDMGLQIGSVDFGSPADAVGLRAGDVITGVDGTATQSNEQLQRTIASRSVGDAIKLSLLRPMTLNVKLDPNSTISVDGQSKPALGVAVTESKRGLVVNSVNDGSPAATAGIKVGDFIIRIAGHDVSTLAEFRKRVGSQKPDDTIEVSLIRKEQPTSLQLILGKQLTPEEMPTLTGWDSNNPRVFRRPVYRLAVIPIAFSDVGLNEKVKVGDWDKALFSTGVYKETNATGQAVYGSLNDYYREMSFGKFEVKGKVFEAVTVPRKRSEYTQSPTKTALLVEACDLLLQRDGDASFKDFDGIFFIYAGRRMQTQRTSIFWPHRSGFAYKGVRWPYFICPEGGDRGGIGSASERMASISVMSHEFGHMLGLPDLYARPDNPGEIGLGIWCSMSTGHGQDGKPIHFSAWCKEQLGWLKPAVIDPREKQKLVLSPVHSSEHECFKVLLRPDGSEYLLLENRLKKNFDRDLPAEGLLIWRVVDGRPVLEESHGIGGNEGTRRFLGSVPYPSPSNRSFTPDTTPSSRSLRSGAWPVHITDIRRLDDGRITFQIGFEYL